MNKYERKMQQRAFWKIKFLTKLKRLALKFRMYEVYKKLDAKWSEIHEYLLGIDKTGTSRRRV